FATRMDELLFPKSSTEGERSLRCCFPFPRSFLARSCLRPVNYFSLASFSLLFITEVHVTINVSKESHVIYKRGKKPRNITESALRGRRGAGQSCRNGWACLISIVEAAPVKGIRAGQREKVAGPRSGEDAARLLLHAHPTD
ncbi:hypothetical protein PENTCL1PPCAC_3601, partial [Pristionchus entomophagus]